MKMLQFINILKTLFLSFFSQLFKFNFVRQREAKKGVGGLRIDDEAESQARSSPKKGHDLCVVGLGRHGALDALHCSAELCN